MSMGAPARLTRAAVAASLATGVALASHVLGGGAMPSLLGVAVPYALSLTVCVQLAGRAGSVWRTAVGVTLSQALFHSLFVIGAGGVSMSAAAHAHHLEAGALAVDATAHASHGGGTMTLAHLVAAVATTAALARLDWALMRARRTVGWLAAILVPLVGPAPVRIGDPGRLTPWAPLAFRPHAVLLGGPGPRAPPVR